MLLHRRKTDEKTEKGEEMEEGEEEDVWRACLCMNERERETVAN